MSKLAAFLIIAMLGGCAWNMDRTQIHDPNGLVFESLTSQTLFLYYTTNKNIHKTTPYSRMSIGLISQRPDPNTPEIAGKVTEGVIKGAVIVGGL
ncbi:MAG: hypothetical protein LLF76_02895 [Planctomycetaceae bacterium]|nr:hypothetical protein [Planctomycetaceae bacterium]